MSVVTDRLVLRSITAEDVAAVHDNRSLSDWAPDFPSEIGYGIVESRRRRGYATEVVMAMLGHAFAKPEVAEVVATADLNNPASIRVLKKAARPSIPEPSRK